MVKVSFVQSQIAYCCGGIFQTKQIDLLIFSRALLKAQAIGIMIAWASKNRKVNKKPISIEETSKTQSSFSYTQWLSESRSTFDFKVKIKAMTAIQIVSDVFCLVGKICTHTLCAWISKKCGLYITFFPQSLNGLGRRYINSSWLQIRELMNLYICFLKLIKNFIYRICDFIKAEVW